MNIKKYTLSIIIPFFNSRVYLKNKCNLIQRIKKKNNVEAIFVNDGSTDLKKSQIDLIFKEFKSLKIYHTNHNGPGHARNLGIRKSNANWVMFFDIDDQLSIKNFPKLIELLNKNLINDIVSIKHMILRNKNKLKDKNYKPHLIKLNKIDRIRKFVKLEMDGSVIFSVFKYDFIIKNNIFFNKGLYEDILFIFKAYFYSKKNVLIFPKTIYFKENNPKSITSNFGKLHVEGYYNFWKKVYIMHNENHKNLSDIINFDELQFGLRGAAGFMIKRLLKSKISISNKKSNLQLIRQKFIKIITKSFNVNTLYDSLTYDMLNNLNLKDFQNKYSDLL